MKTLAKISASFLLCSVATTTFAQDSETPPPPPQAPPAICFENERFSDFDFWVGEWNVYGQHPQTGERILAGTNSITKHYANCLIMETWENAGGAGGGFSMNFYDPIEDQWRQVWVSPNLSINYTGGLNEDGQMVLEGDIHYYTQDGGNSAPFRGIWTANDDGTVTQHFEQQNAETGEWVVWFVGEYVRKENDPDAPEGQ